MALIELHDAQAVDPNNTGVVINTNEVVEVWQHPTLGCLIELSNSQNVATVETYAAVKTALGVV